MTRSIFCLLLLCCIFLPAEGQWRGPLLERFGPDDNMNGDVRDIAQDSLGYIYLASSQGLYQYDGRSFHLYGHDPEDPHSIAPGHVFSVMAGRDGLVWLAIYGSGLNSFDPVTQRFTRYPLPEHNISEFNGAFSLAEDDRGDIWVGGYHYRLHRFDRSQETFQVFTPPWLDTTTLLHNRKDLVALMFDRSDPDLLWITVMDVAAPAAILPGAGIYSFNRATRSFEWTNCNGRLKYQDANGRLWGVIWGSDVTRYDPVSATCEFLPLHRLFSASSDNGTPRSTDILSLDDRLIITNINGLIGLDQNDHMEWVLQSNAQPEYGNGLVDRDNNVWVGTPDAVEVIAPQNQQIRFFSLETFGVTWRQFPTRIAYDSLRNVIYLPEIMQHEDKVIYEIPLDESRRADARKLEVGFFVTGATYDKQGQLWIAGKGSFHLYDPHHGSVTEAKEESMMPGTVPWLWHMRTNDNGWVGAAGEKEFIWFHPQQRQVRRIHFADVMRDKDIWSANGFTFARGNKAHVFVEHRLVEIDLITGASRPLEWPVGISEKVPLLHSAQFTTDSILWVATYPTLFKLALRSSGLVLKDQYTIKDGIISPTMSEIHIDQAGRVWIFTHGGMSCLDPESNVIKSFGTKEGLPIPNTDPRQVVTLANGSIATVCGTGLIVYHPDSLWNSVSRPNVPVVIQEVRADGNALNKDFRGGSPMSYHLPKSTRVVDVQFQALAYPTDRHVTYSYKLGDDQQMWIDIGKNNFITLPDLPYGQTVFHVKAGVPQSDATVTQLTILVATPVYAQWWFTPLVALLAALLIYGSYSRRIRMIKQREEEKLRVNKKMAELELKALRSQMNPHFMFNSLNSIKTYILEAKPDIAADYLSRFAHLIRRILQNSHERMIPLHEEIETLMLYVSLEQFRFENAFEIVHEMEEGIPVDTVMIPPMLLQPFVENAIWHGLMHKGKDGVLTLKFTKENGQLLCIIDDNGVGRKKAQELKSLSATKHKSMGLGITESRIQLLNNIETYGITMQVIDKMDGHGNSKGTQVILRVPITAENEDDDVFD